MEWYEICWFVFIGLVCFSIGYFTGGRIRKNKDDGIVMLNNERVEVIFRDPYEKLVKKKYVNLKMKS